MKFAPHDYQAFAIDYIETHPAAAVLLDMGLGKTVITLTAIANLLFDSFQAHRVLVIAPLRVARDTWPAEIQKWDHLNGLSYSVIIGTQQERMAALRKQADIYLINRENTQWLIENSGMPFDYDMVVIDELSSFKSWQAKRFKSLMKVRPFVKRVVGLTGTPSSNGLMDLFAEFRLLDMGQRLGRFIGQYRNAFFKPDRMNGPIVYSYKPLPGAKEEIYRRIGDITISMKACGHLKMPELITTNYEVDMSPKEREHYEALKQELVLSLPDGEVTAANAAVLTGKLLQLSSGAIYGDDGSVIHIHDRKLDALEDIIEGMNGRPLLVGYWFKHDLQRITQRLDEVGIPYERLDSEASLKRWNAGQIQVGLAHPASTGHGLNLQDGGNTICWFSPTWSLELYQQMNARLYRQGQKAETVVVTHIVTKGTVDSRVLKALAEKDRIQEALIDAVKAEVKRRGS
jgi:SNF2 family DNA or RNA helicase